MDIYQKGNEIAIAKGTPEEFLSCCTAFPVHSASQHNFTRGPTFPTVALLDNGVPLRWSWIVLSTCLRTACPVITSSPHCGQTRFSLIPSWWCFCRNSFPGFRQTMWNGMADGVRQSFPKICFCFLWGSPAIWVLRNCNICWTKVVFWHSFVFGLVLVFALVS